MSRFQGMGVGFVNLDEAIGSTAQSPSKLDARQVAKIRRLYDSKTVTVNQIAAMMGVGRVAI